MQNLSTLKTYTTRMEALLDKSFLEANDIECFISADDLGGTYPFPFQPTSTGIQLKISKENMDKAKQLLKSVE